MTHTLSVVFIALLLQSFAMAPRATAENPAVVSAVPKKLQKDYGKLWARFVKGTDDANLMKDADKFLKQNGNVVPVIVIEAYIDLYNARASQAEARLEQGLSLEPRNRIALSYLAEFAFARQEYARASDLYARLIEVDPSRTDVETKREKALLLATEDLLRRASKAEQENRIPEAESLYLQALQIAPREPLLHERLGVLFTRQKKWEEALEHFRKERELGGPEDETDRHIAETLANLGRPDEAREMLDRLRKSGSPDQADAALAVKGKELVDIGRWGKDIGIFHQIESASEITREQLAAVFVRYFPKVSDLPRTSQVVTDIQDSWARPEIQAVVGTGVFDPRSNHTFQPTAPVTRGELAVALARLTRLIGVSPATAPAVSTTDVGPGNAIYGEVQSVLGNGLMTLDDTGSFKAEKRVSGKEIVRAAERLLEKERGNRR